MRRPRHSATLDCHQYSSLTSNTRVDVGRTKQRMSFVSISVKADTRPRTQFLLRIFETRRDELLRLVIRDAQHEKVAYVLHIGIVADPEAPENVG
jgi:hypothetical protein